MLLAYAQLASAMALVGANVAVAKLLAAALPIALIACARCAIAAAVLWPLARWRDGQVRLGRRALGNLALQAAFGTALYNAGLLAGLRLTTALEAGLVLATLPAAIALGAALWLRERLRARDWIAAALAALGMAAVTLARPAEAGAGAVLGNLLVFAGVCGEAAYVLLAKRLGTTVPVLTASFWMQALSVAVLLPFALPDAAALTALTDPTLAALLVGHSLTASVLCVLLWYAGLRHVPAGTAGVFTALLPTTAAAVAVLVLGETVAPWHAIGFGCMGASLALATWPGRRA